MYPRIMQLRRLAVIQNIVKIPIKPIKICLFLWSFPKWCHPLSSSWLLWYCCLLPWQPNRKERKHRTIIGGSGHVRCRRLLSSWIARDGGYANPSRLQLLVVVGAVYLRPDLTAMELELLQAVRAAHHSSQSSENIESQDAGGKLF